jgi:hypothetical protein
MQQIRTFQDNLSAFALQAVCDESKSSSALVHAEVLRPILTYCETFPVVTTALQRLGGVQHEALPRTMQELTTL